MNEQVSELMSERASECVLSEWYGGRRLVSE